MITANAIVTNIIVDNSKVWLEFKVEGKYFPVHYEFDVSLLSDLSKLMFLIKRTKAKNIEGLLGKNVRIIDNEQTCNSLVALGDISKNKFVDLSGSEFPVSERRLYRKYKY